MSNEKDQKNPQSVNQENITPKRRTPEEVDAWADEEEAKLQLASAELDRRNWERYWEEDEESGSGSNK